MEQVSKALNQKRQHTKSILKDISRVKTYPSRNTKDPDLNKNDFSYIC